MTNGWRASRVPSASERWVGSGTRVIRCLEAAMGGTGSILPMHEFAGRKPRFTFFEKKNAGKSRRFFAPRLREDDVK